MSWIDTKKYTWQLQKQFPLEYLLVEKWTREVFQRCQIFSFKTITFPRQTALKGYASPWAVFIHVCLLCTSKKRANRPENHWHGVDESEITELSTGNISNNMASHVVYWILPGEKNSNVITYFLLEELPVFGFTLYILLCFKIRFVISICFLFDEQLFVNAANMFIQFIDTTKTRSPQCLTICLLVFMALAFATSNV